MGLGLAKLLERRIGEPSRGRIAYHSGAALMLATSASPRMAIGAHA